MDAIPSPVPSPPQPATEGLGGGELITLPSGGWIRLRPSDDIRGHHRDYVLDTITMSSDITMRAIRGMQSALAEVMITEWEIPYLPDAPLPMTVPYTTGASPLRELKISDEDELNRALEPYAELINPRKVSADDHADPDSPSVPDGASAHA